MNKESRDFDGPDLSTMAGVRAHKLERLFAEHPKRAQKQDLADFFGKKGLNPYPSKITKLCQKFADPGGKYLEAVCEFFDVSEDWFNRRDPNEPIPSAEETVEAEARSTLNWFVKRYGVFWAAETLAEAPKPPRTSQ